MLKEKQKTETHHAKAMSTHMHLNWKGRTKPLSLEICIINLLSISPYFQFLYVIWYIIPTWMVWSKMYFYIYTQVHFSHQEEAIVHTRLSAE